MEGKLFASPVALLDRTEVIHLLFQIIEIRDKSTAKHSLSMAMYSKYIAKQFDPENEMEYYYAGLVHDIGKIAIPDYILKGSEKLTADDRGLVQDHVRYGEQILLSAGLDGVIFDVCSYHHERMDGSGYCKGLVSKEIPLCARIAGIADTYATLIDGRQYSKARTKYEALNIMKSESYLFDKTILNWFIKDQLSLDINLKSNII